MKKIVFIFSLLLTISFQINAQWVLQSSGTNEWLYSVVFTDSLTGFAVGTNGTILKTNNAGINWMTLSSGTYYQLTSIYFVDSLLGFAAGDKGTIRKTIDGGENWYTQTTGTLRIIRSIYFNDDTSGFFVTGNLAPPPVSLYFGQIDKTTDSGSNWLQIYDGIGLNSIFFVNENTGYGAGAYGLIIKSSNHGNNWETLSTGVSDYLYSVHFYDNNNGYAVGANGIIIKTTDGGISWVTQSTGTADDLYSVFCTSIHNAFACGKNGTILKTTDGGANWNKEKTGTSKEIYSIYFVTNFTGFAVGQSGIILKNTNGGVTFTEEENNFTQPTESLLEQNYPNPFNPNTSIQYVISNTQFVTLKVYGLLGGEVATLVNEEKPAGSYNVQFTINNLQLSTGVYFYRLQAGDFVETKKMILLK